MSQLNRETIRSRGLRELILRRLLGHYQAGLDLGYTAEQIRQFETSHCAFTEAEHVRAIRSLEHDGLIGILEAGDDEPDRYVLTDDGDDFLRAGLPWRRIDPYSGGGDAQ